MTLQQAAKDAILVQDACNLSGVARSFVEVIDTVKNLGLRGEEVNLHPIVVMFANKIADMTGNGGSFDAFSKAYAACKELAAGNQPEVS